MSLSRIAIASSDLQVGALMPVNVSGRAAGREVSGGGWDADLVYWQIMSAGK